MSLRLIALLAAGLSVGVPAGVCPAEPGANKVAAKKAVAEPKTLAKLFPDEKQPDLWVGDKAPDLKIAQFLRGDSVSRFEPGRVYVVEFWATWCGPCIKAFPHVAELQKKHADDLTVIGVNVWERATDAAERAELVTNFVEEHDEMAYTVALEEGTAMADTWMKPAGQNGIPAAFIVNGEGVIAWMGHPMELEEPLEKVIAGEYDIAEAKDAIWRDHMTMTGLMGLRQAAGRGEWDRANAISAALVNGALAEDPQGLNAVAWMLVNGDGAPDESLELAYEAAHKAGELTDWSEWMILDTYALAAFKHGDKAEAIKWQTRAVELAPEENKAELQAMLDSFTDEG